MGQTSPIKNQRTKLGKNTGRVPRAFCIWIFGLATKGGSASSTTKVPMARGGSDLRLKDTNKMWPHKQQTRWRSKTSAILTSTEEEIEIVFCVIWHMPRILLCTTHLRESNVFSFFNQNWCCKEEDREPAHPTTCHSKYLGTIGYVDDFACRILVARVREPRRWRPPATHRCRGAGPAWSGPSEAARCNKARRSRP